MVSRFSKQNSSLGLFFERSTSKRDKLLQTYCALGIGFVCVIIGLPLWWKTTEVYRVNLPYSTIADSDRAEISIVTKFEVIVPEELTETTWFMEKLDAELDAQLNYLADGYSLVRVRYEFDIKKTNDEESSLLLDDIESITSLEKELDKQFHRTTKEVGSYKFYILPVSRAELFDHSPAVLLSSRNIFIRHSPDVAQVARTIGKVLRGFIVREKDFSEVYISTKRSEQMELNKDSMRSLRSSLGYDLIFTLMNPQPDIVSAQWEIESAVETYMNPIIKQLSEYADIFIRSQYIHLTGINAQAQWNKEHECYVLPVSKLPFIINPIEPYLASHVTSNPTLNFVVYIPTRDQTPLKIFDQSGHPSKTNAFLAPRWGGLLIYNIETPIPEINSTVQFPFSSHIDLGKMFSTFLPQFKSLLGFRKVSEDSVKMIRSKPQVISDWELDSWLMERTIENIGKSSSTLNSLSQLLNHISNIVINDEVADRVKTAASSTQQSLELLEKAQLKNAYIYSREALNSSEKAFFDPSLLELLYFPEDQKFAIYIPLFLPIGIPVVGSLFYAFKYLKGVKKEG